MKLINEKWLQLKFFSLKKEFMLLSINIFTFLFFILPWLVVLNHKENTAKYKFTIIEEKQIE